MVTIVCDLEEELISEWQRFTDEKSTVEIPSAIVMMCKKESKKLALEEVLEEVDINELGEDLHGTNRLVFLRCGKRVPQDEERVLPAVLLIWFNPAESARVDIKRMYQATAQMLVDKCNCYVQEGASLKSYHQINNCHDFNEKWFESRGYTLLPATG